MAAELDHRIGARFERSQHVERWNAATGPMTDFAVGRDHDSGAMKCVDELRGDDADDAAVPALSRDHDHRTRSDFEIGLHQLAGLSDDVGFFFLPTEIFGVELL